MARNRARLTKAITLGMLRPYLPFAYGAYAAFDFTNDCALWAGVQSELSSVPGWTFTRASTGYALDLAGNLVSFASGALRRTDRGVLIEGARTNRILRSQEFDNASWIKTAGSITANAATAPDGTSTADYFVPNTSTVQHFVRQSTAATTSGKTCSVYAKKDSAVDKIAFYPGGSGTVAYFNLTTLAVIVEANVVSARIVQLANGWLRLEATFNTTSLDRFSIYCSSGSYGLDSTAGDGVSGVYLWGAQEEDAASFASSYIPTTTASVTRAADALSITGVSGITYPLTAFIRFRRAVDTAAAEHWFSMNDGTANEASRLGVTASDTFDAVMTDGGVDVAAPSVAGALVVGTVYNAAARFAVDDVQACRSGTLGTADTSAAVPATPSAICIGSGVSGASPSFGYIERAAIWNGAFADADLQAQTT